MLERELEGRGVKAQSVIDAKRVNGNGIPIVHAHGFIPRTGPISRANVGLSMSDPNLRRLLDASRNSDIPPHWQIQKRHEIHDHQVLEAMRDVERRAREYGAILGREFDETKTPRELEKSIHAALRQADSYDRQVFESLGVKTVWVDSFVPGNGGD